MKSPIYTITDDINNKCIKIVELISRIKSSENFRQRLSIIKKSNLRSVHSSLRIEGVYFDIDEVADIVNDRNVFADPRDISAVKNTYGLYSKMEKSDPHSLGDFVDAQKTMMVNVIPDKHLGLRKVAVGVYDGSIGKIIYEAPKPEFVEPMMGSLFEWFDETDCHPLIASAIMHLNIEIIHPFADGNGRTGRFWHRLILSKWDRLFLRIPIETNILAHQMQYYDVLKKCEDGGDCTPFIEFSLDIIMESLKEALDLGTDDRVVRLVSVMAKDKEYSARELMNILDLKDLGKFRENYINKALENKAIRMTEPNSPRSRNQRYRLIDKN